MRIRHTILSNLQYAQETGKSGITSKGLHSIINAHLSVDATVKQVEKILTYLHNAGFITFSKSIYYSICSITDYGQQELDRVATRLATL